MTMHEEPDEGQAGRQPGLTIKSPLGYDRFGLLLALLVLAFVLSPTRETAWTHAALSIAALASALAATGLWERRPRLVVLVGSFGIGGAVLVGVFPQTSTMAAVGALGQAMVLLVILTAVVERVLDHDRVGVQTIRGAITAYFLIGLSYAWIYLAVDGLVEASVLNPAIDGLPSYYSFVVLTTLGFGDVTPVNDLAQRITAVEAMTGQIFLATLVARLVSLYGQERTRA